MLNFDWLASVPVESAKWFFYGLFILIGLLIIIIPNEYIFEGIEVKDRHWWMNLKIWALAVLSILYYTYFLF